MTLGNYIQNFPFPERLGPEMPEAGGINATHTPTGSNSLPMALAYWLAEINLRAQSLTKATSHRQTDAPAHKRMQV